MPDRNYLVKEEELGKACAERRRIDEWMNEWGNEEQNGEEGAER